MPRRTPKKFAFRCCIIFNELFYLLPNLFTVQLFVMQQSMVVGRVNYQLFPVPRRRHGGDKVGGAGADKRQGGRVARGGQGGDRARGALHRRGAHAGHRVLLLPQPRPRE